MRRWFSGNGLRREEYSCLNGKKNGLYRQWDINGNLIDSAVFIDDEKVV